LKEESAAYPAPPVRRVKTGSGVSIKEKILQKREVDDQENDNGYSVQIREEHFDQQRLEEAWTLYASEIAEKLPNLHSTLTKRKPQLQSEHTIELIIDNKVQEDELNENKPEMMEFLRSKLKNDRIRINTSLSVNAQDQRPYTPLEKYKKMTGKNPDLAHFKDQLGLDIDF
jgi:DNA polymerase-3 subunit gamma/tau